MRLIELPRWSKILLGFVVVAGVALFLTGEVYAATRTWDGDTDNEWDTSTCTNWSDDTCPTASDIAVIQNTTVYVVEAITVGELQLGDDSGDGDTILDFKYDAVGGTGMTISTGSGQNGSVTVNGDATIRHSAPVTGGAVYTLDMVIQGSLTIDATAEIDVSELGCQGDTNDGQGPDGSNVCTNATSGFGQGWGFASDVGAMGAGHGGLGGAGDTNLGALGTTYDSTTTPAMFGSSGGGVVNRGLSGGHGGGVIHLNVTGTLTKNGNIAANGKDGGGSGNSAAGGGSGGAIYIVADTLAGSGNITANGGDGGTGTTNDGGGAGGGIIAITYTNGSLSGSVTATKGVKGTNDDGGDAADGNDGVATTTQLVAFSAASTAVASAGQTTVNRLTITFNQNVDITDASAGDGLDVITLSASSGTCTIDNADYSDTNTSTLTLQVTCTASNDTSITVDPTYTTAGSSTIVDTGGSTEIANSTTVSGSDGAAPAFISASATDDEVIEITMSETVDSVTFGGPADWGATGVTATGASVNSGDDTIIDLSVSSLGDTSFTASDLAFGAGDVGGAIQDASSNSAADFSSKSIADGQAPAFSSAKYEDSDSDGAVDRIAITLSESISTNAATLGDFTYVANDITSSDLSGGSNLGTTGSATIYLNLGTNGAANTTSHSTAPTIAYTFSSGALEDAAGNQTSNFTAQNLSDGAGPVLVSSSPENTEKSVQLTADIVLTFSEAIDTGSLAYSITAGTDPEGWSEAWTVSDTVVTLSHNNFKAAEDITFDITAAPDTAANAFVSTSIDPFTFTTVSLGGTPTPGAGPASTVTVITVDSPNGGEDLMGAGTTAITWSASGDNLSTISIYYSSDSGRTYTLVAEGEENDGTYSWYVPNEDTSAARVKVAGMNSAGAELISDISNSNFSISMTDEIELPEVPDPDEVTPEETVVTMTDTSGDEVSLAEGSLFRGDTLSGVYLVQNGTRYVFPNEAVFNSYGYSFDDVLFVQDDQLQKLALGERMVMAPGQLVKIQSDPKVYEVQADGLLRHVPDEDTARALYGDSWNTMITDINVVFWFDYTIGDPLI